MNNPEENEQAKDMFHDMMAQGFEMWSSYFNMWIQWNQLFFNAFQGNFMRFLEQSIPDKNKTKAKIKKD